MAIIIKIETKHLYLFVAIMVFLVASGIVIAVWTDPGQSHPSQQIKVTIGGVDYSLQEAIDNNLIGGGEVGKIVLRNCQWSGTRHYGGDQDEDCMSLFGPTYVQVGMDLIKGNDYNRYNRIKCCNVTIG